MQHWICEDWQKLLGPVHERSCSSGGLHTGGWARRRLWSSTPLLFCVIWRSICKAEQDSRRNKLRNLYEEGFEGRGLCADLLALQASCPGDSVLRDVLTPRKLRHNLPVIFPLDDFQFSIEALADNVQYSQPTRVTIHGIQSVLGVISTPSFGVPFWSAILQTCSKRDSCCRCCYAIKLFRHSLKNIITRCNEQLNETE